jgi:lipopolysaccharide/colanic/teichoic acid biosynthesis glycosyltransferase
MIPHWNQLPAKMRTPQVREYYDLLQRRKGSLLCKRVMDVVLAAALTLALSPVMLLLAIWIRLDSKGPVFYRQVRVTQYGKQYRIFKFRTMVADADKKGPLVTTKEDGRITRVGKLLRKCRLDELPQLFHVLTGDMTFVGTRPEVQKYVDGYTPEMYATLLLPAGITSQTSILYKDEDEKMAQYCQNSSKTVDEIYIEDILPEKMTYNLTYLRHFRFWSDCKVMIETVLAVLR